MLPLLVKYVCQQTAMCPLNDFQNQIEDYSELGTILIYI